MEGEVIKSFLVGLGFDIDEAGLAKFSKAIQSATVRVTALYASIQFAAAGIFKAISGIASGFEEVGYQLRLVAPAVNKMLILRQAMLDAYKRAGIDLTKVVKQSILFNYSLAKTKFALEAVYKSVGARFLPLLTKQMDIFRGKIFANMPKIQDALMKFVNFIFKAFEATVQLGTRIWSILGRVYDFLKQLDEATNGWSTKILVFIGIWKALNLAFLATPLGMILTGLVALLALFDDFKTWQEGGESLFDWSKFVPVITAVGDAVSAVFTIFKSNLQLLSDFVFMLYKLVTFDFSGFKAGWAAMARDIENYISGMVGYLKAFVEYAKAIIGWLPSAASAVGSFFGVGGGAQAGVQNVLQPQPIVAGGSNVSQKVSQETNILVQGSADAHAVGKAVASEQGKVNFDMTRNLKGAVR